MESEFWEMLEQYKRNQNISHLFVENYRIIFNKQMRYHDIVGDMFCEYVGNDKGHHDFCDFIIWNGKKSVENFLQNPTFVLGEKMLEGYGFNDDIVHFS